MSYLARLQRHLRQTSRARLSLYAAAAAASSLLLRLARLKALQEAAVLLAPVSELLKAVEAGRVRGAVVTIGACAYQLADGRNCRSTLLPADSKLLVTLLHRHAVPYRAQGPPGWRAALVLLVPFAYLGVCGWLLHRMTSDNGFNGGGSDGGGAGTGDGASGAGADGRAEVGWEDVAGLPRVKAAVMEVVDVMTRPDHYARLGARCPRGVLLYGPPGTGKTLLAKAVASEARVPFLACTGSDFVEVFVGRGARRVRTLFEDAARRAPYARCAPPKSRARASHRLASHRIGSDRIGSVAHAASLITPAAQHF
jgi:cell division protease FtsH